MFLNIAHENVEKHNEALYLTWTDHIKQIYSKARRLVGLLFRQFYNYADPSTITILYLTLIRPKFEYASEVWDPYLIRDRSLLENVQKFACKVCLKNWQSMLTC